MWEYFADALDMGIFNAGYVNPAQLTDRLNWYGRQGWELVNTFDTQSGSGGSRQVILIFKRFVPTPGTPPVQQASA